MTPATSTRSTAKAGPVLVFARPAPVAPPASDTASLARLMGKIAELDARRPLAAAFIERLIDNLLDG